MAAKVEDNRANDYSGSLSYILRFHGGRFPAICRGYIFALRTTPTDTPAEIVYRKRRDLI